ncbi:MAG: DegT/DnrJ/EryC1/StrS family aminotransferase [Candidatus Bathyarchaeia archaeon]
MGRPREHKKPLSEEFIPISKPLIGEEEIRSAAEVLRSGMLRQGEKTEAFEQLFSKLVGSEYACATSSGTASLHIAYMSTLRAGDEVIVPDFTFFSTASTVIYSGGVPVFADVDLGTFTIDVEDAKEKITNRTKAIVPVHLFGNSADLRPILEIAEDKELTVISDAAQALGTQYDGKDVGSYGDIVCYSFYPTKNITTCEGGMITTDRKELDSKFRLMREHGQSSRYLHTTLGLNYRMTDVEAAVGMEQIKKLGAFLGKRKSNAEFLTENLKTFDKIETPYVKPNVAHSFNQYTIKLGLEQLNCSRDDFANVLKLENIGSAVYYPTPLHLQPIFMSILHMKEGTCPVSEDLAGRVLSLPVHPSLTQTDLENICKAVEKAIESYSKD